MWYIAEIFLISRSYKIPQAKKSSNYEKWSWESIRGPETSLRFPKKPIQKFYVFQRALRHIPKTFVYVRHSKLESERNLEEIRIGIHEIPKRKSLISKKEFRINLHQQEQILSFVKNLGSRI